MAASNRTGMAVPLTDGATATVASLCLPQPSVPYPFRQAIASNQTWF